MVFFSLLFLRTDVIALILTLCLAHGVEDEIVKSLPDGAWIAIPVNLLMVITVIGGFPLWMEPVNEMVEGHWGECTKGKIFITNPVYIIFRIVEIVLISVVAYFVPHFGDILSVVGNFTDNITTFIFPAFMHLRLLRKKRSIGIQSLDWFILVFSFVLMIVCTTVSFKTLIEHLLHK